MCSDGNACNGAETCLGGACTLTGAAPDCTDTNSCTVDACNPSSGCVHPPTIDGSSCADGNTCNGDEICHGGTCTPGLPNTCNDSNACTTDSCDPVAGCRHVAVADGTTCSDGNVCTGSEVCQAGVCLVGTPLDCNDGNPCTSDACDAIAGCPHPPVTAGSPCSDGDPCNGAETCQAGSCTAGPPPTCNDNNSCTADSCQPGVGCQHVAIPNGSSCNDGNWCNGAEFCQAGLCAPGTPLDCSDSNPCTTESCSPITGCVVTPLANGTSCDDTNTCNGTEVCQGGSCIAGTPQPDGTACDDGNACNGSETCQAAACVSGSALSCDDANPVTSDVCGAVTGCQHDVPIPGKKLKLTSLVRRANVPNIRVTTRNAIGVSNPPTNGTPVDPVLNGGSLRVITTSGFDHTYPLAASGWTYRGRPGLNRGYIYSVGTKHIVVRDAMAKITANLPEAPLSLAQNPGPVTIVLQLGANRYCMSFGGVSAFSRQKNYRATSAPAPAACPPL